MSTVGRRAVDGREAGLAVVTGAAGRTGGRIADRLAAEGWRVVGVDRRPCPAEAALEAALEADVTDLEAMRRAAEKVALHGVPRLLVTAASAHDAAPAGDLPAERWRSLLDTVLVGTANAVRAFVPAMVDAGRGTVVTLSSWSALVGRPGEVYFAAAVGAVLGFTRSFACEVAPHGVCVNCVAAGPEAACSPDDVAETVLFLAAEGDFFVGQVFTPGLGEVV